MENDTEVKIRKISQYLWAYAIILILGALWNVLDGDIENIRDFIRGIIRSCVMIFLAKTIWDLKKASWWCIASLTCLFSVFGIVAVVMLFVAGVMVDQSKIVFMALTIIPTVALLIKIFLLIIQKDVKVQFLN
ncbi:hypothetical protein [Psychromonas sp. Urea-02u-13]|uniref:hypothetical protein n=1 Tax=Psychromonas sp. Urea-02u-13 TaxID=2058326 RepID=UPI000C347A94|nr:hypothetical protein [Psychromonas sp. Urea-02u-13]PKG36923.1 hypothetical protein CXF74_21615 [Psychromonas sp. Urea-02u-13]